MLDDYDCAICVFRNNNDVCSQCSVGEFFEEEDQSLHFDDEDEEMTA
jgi:hypothetical protein